MGRFLFWIWLGGTVLSLMVFLFRAWQVNRFLKSCQPVEISEYISTEALDVLSQKFKLSWKQQG
ncbi:hypothetical protein V6x_44770 [Gimesia chilikensis]|uniref:Uncharacterized protein n=1 Tax=Gimesia chilikensis TaxID=2605989 RepID=A0A517WHL0_9PLAN|nr:hypothetical protein [Gimesia chilikensis]QDU04746.1 hypothetical protein V6x_44770 [Gimesia chilikensis]